MAPLPPCLEKSWIKDSPHRMPPSAATPSLLPQKSTLALTRTLTHAHANKHTYTHTHANTEYPNADPQRDHCQFPVTGPGWIYCGVFRARQETNCHGN